MSSWIEIPENFPEVAALKFHDPEIAKIRLYDLRHFYGSMLYHKTKDLLHVKDQMGHKSISSTMVYMHLVNFESDEYTVKAAKTLDEAYQLIESERKRLTPFLLYIMSFYHDFGCINNSSE